MSMLTTIRTALAQRAAYVRTRDEIASLPRNVALELGFFPEDAAQIARKHVYG
jgi:hypothetical protein